MTCGHLLQRQGRVEGGVAAAHHDHMLGLDLLERRQPVREPLADEAVFVPDAEAPRDEAAEAQGEDDGA